MYLKFLCGQIHFEFVLEDRELSIYLFLGSKVIFNYEKFFPKKFRCIYCGEKVESDGNKLKLCADHYEEFMKQLDNKMK